MYNNEAKEILEAQNGNHESMSKLVELNSGLIWSIVKRFTCRGFEIEDLYQIGAIGLIKSIKRFDTNFDVKLSTYAVPYILGEIKRFIRDDGIIKISRQTKELSIKIKGIQKEYFNKKGEDISISELSQILEVSKEEIAAAIESTNPVDSIYSNENSSEDQRMLIEKISSNKDEYSSLLDNITLKEVIDNLDERERKIILLRFYKEQTQSQVGKILGITQVQVSRIEKKVLEKMKAKLEVV